MTKVQSACQLCRQAISEGPGSLILTSRSAAPYAFARWRLTLNGAGPANRRARVKNFRMVAGNHETTIEPRMKVTVRRGALDHISVVPRLEGERMLVLISRAVKEVITVDGL